jgi:hypothetical protein
MADASEPVAPSMDEPTIKPKFASKQAFLRSLPDDMPKARIIELGAEQGLAIQDYDFRDFKQNKKKVPAKGAHRNSGPVPDPNSVAGFLRSLPLDTTTNEVRRLARKAGHRRVASSQISLWRKWARAQAGKGKSPAPAVTAPPPLAAASKPRAAFVRLFPTDTPVMDVIRVAREQGFADLKTYHVHAARIAMQEQGIAGATKMPVFAAPRTPPPPLAAARENETAELFRRTIARIGLDKARELLDEVERLIGGGA